MATLIASISSCVSRMTSGERRLAERLEQKLDDDYELTLTLVLLLHQEDWALDAARATNHQVTALKWAKEINSSLLKI